MAYEKQTWQTGDVITQEKLNHMEEGIEDSVGGGKGVDIYIVEFVTGSNPITADKTRSEVMQAFSDNKIVLGHTHVDLGGGMIAASEYSLINCYSGQMSVTFNTSVYITTSADPDSSTSWQKRDY